MLQTTNLLTLVMATQIQQIKDNYLLARVQNILLHIHQYTQNNEGNIYIYI